MDAQATRFWVKVDRNGPVHPVLGTPCWNWTAATCDKGYGRFYANGKVTGAHQFSYELHVGKIPLRSDIDHRCHNHACVNPRHLRAVTRKQNMENLTGAHSDSTSKVRGVWQLPNGRWRAVVGHNYKTIHVGVFDTKEQAAQAVTAKRNDLFSCNDSDREVRHLEGVEVS